MADVCYAVTLVLLFVNSMVLAASDDYFECDALFNDTISDLSCCDSKFLFEDSSESSKCKDVNDEEEMSCEDYKCLLDEEGLLEGDKISEDKASEIFVQWEKEYPKEKPMIDRARNECLSGKYLEMIPDEKCAPLKFYVCMFINTFIECQSWKTGPKCMKTKEYAEKCKAQLDSK